MICIACGAELGDRGCACERTAGEVFMDEVYELVRDPVTDERIFRRRVPERGFLASEGRP